MLKNYGFKLFKVQLYRFCLLFCITTAGWAGKELTQEEITEKYTLKIPEAEAQKLVYNPMTHARIRLYGQTSTKIYVQHSFDCDGRKQGIREYISNNGGWDAFKSYARIIMNTSIGMPKTDILKTTLTNEFQTYLYISNKELILNADQPVNLHGFVIGAEDEQKMNKATVIDRCESAEASFIPKRGHDYEVLGIKKDGQCLFKVYDLQTKQPITINSQPYACAKKTSWKFWKN